MFAVTFVAIFLAELGDKTQLTALALAANAPTAKLLVFAGAAAAMILSSLLGVLLGDLLARALKPRTLNVLAGLIFLGCAAFFACQVLFGGETEASSAATASAPESQSPWAAMAMAFAAIFVAELGDKTQLATFSLAAGNRHARWMVFAGSSLALVTASGLACLLGGFLADWIQGGYITLAAAAMFAVLGLLFLLGFAEKGRREFAWLAKEIERRYADEKCRHCRRFAVFLEHVRDIGSPTGTKRIDELLASGAAAGHAPCDCAECETLTLHRRWHEKFEHEDEKPFEEG